MKKLLFVAAAVVSLAGCSKWKNEEPEFTFKIQAMNLEGANAMAHLQSGAGTKASVGFEQEDALYLVYDNNEIRLPEITFTVEVPDSYSERDKKKLMEDVHVSIGEPKIKDFGNYIYVYSSLSYYTTFNGSLECPPLQAMGPGSQNSVPHSNTLIRKSDGQCLTIDDNLGDTLYWSSLMAEDSHGQCYFFSGSKLCSLVHTDNGFDLRSVDMVVPLLSTAMLECNDNIYVVSRLNYYDPESGGEVLTSVLYKVLPDLSYDSMSVNGECFAFEKYGDKAYLFVNEDSAFKVYCVDSGCELVASTTVETGVEGVQLLSDEGGVYTYYYNGAIVRFDAKSRECAASELDETVRCYLSDRNAFIGGKFYLVYSPWDSGYVEVIKIDVLTETIEQLKVIEIPAGCYFSGGISLVDESMGKLQLYGCFVNKVDGAIMVEIGDEEIYDPEIAEAYAKAKAEANYGIDFGSYEVVTVVPLDESLKASDK